jgi:CDGSH-type Zn-finger protein
MTSSRSRPRPTTLTPYPDGPAVVRGSFRLVDADGVEVTTHRRAVALCRCGRSRTGPLCDGTHRSVGFRAAGGRPRPVGSVVQVPLPTQDA